jgi:hypothetical protein
MTTEELSSYHLHCSGGYPVDRRERSSEDIHARIAGEVLGQLCDTYAQLAEAGVVETVEDFDSLCESGSEEADGYVSVWSKAEVPALPPTGGVA